MKASGKVDEEISVAREPLVVVARQADGSWPIPFEQGDLFAKVESFHYPAEESRVCRPAERCGIPIVIDAALRLDVLDVIGFAAKATEAEDVLEKRPGISGPTKRMVRTGAADHHTFGHRSITRPVCIIPSRSQRGDGLWRLVNFPVDNDAGREICRRQLQLDVTNGAPMRKPIVGVIGALGALLFASTVSRADPNLSVAELSAVYKAAGLKERSGKVIDDCGQPVTPQVDVIDLNGDGQPEVFVLATDAICYGDAGGQLSLLIKDKQGHWQANLGIPAGGYTVLKTKSQGYPDIEIGGPGFCFPVWRWNGKQYAIYKRCDS